MASKVQNDWLVETFGVDLSKLEEASAGPEAGESAASSFALPMIDLDVEFNAFIPGSLGCKADAFGHPAKLKNQQEFEASLAKLGGTWLLEPGDAPRVSGYGPWVFETDNRELGGGSHRVGSRGRITGEVGRIGSSPTIFTHTTSGSTHFRYRHDGWLSSDGATGWIETEGPKSAKVSARESKNDSGNVSFVEIRCKGAYPFATIAPSIDYYVQFKFTENAGQVDLTCDIQSNTFPFYELILNGKLVWHHKGEGGGPGIFNLAISKQKSAYQQRL